MSCPERTSAAASGGAAPPPGLARCGVSWAAVALATGLGAGLAPIAPGTAGSAVGLALFWPLSQLATAYQLGAVAVVFLLGVPAGALVARRVGREDPGVVVVDEIVGMWVALLFLPLTPLTAVAAFLLFRGLDIVKPYPARELERLPGGWGIMADDLMAGVYANLLLRLGLAVWPVA